MKKMKFDIIIIILFIIINKKIKIFNSINKIINSFIIKLNAKFTRFKNLKIEIIN